ncbi:MAG: lipoprotein [Succinivibrionaceae bacterium]
MKKILFYITFWAFLSGCSQFKNSNEIDANLNSSKNFLTHSETDCMKQNGCFFLKKYTNALGQECKSYKNKNDIKLIFCKKNNTWESIKVL